MEKRDDDKSRDRDGDRTSGREWGEDGLEQRDAAEVCRREQRRNGGVDERSADENVDVVEAIGVGSWGSLLGGPIAVGSAMRP